MAKEISAYCCRKVKVHTVFMSAMPRTRKLNLKCTACDVLVFDVPCLAAGKNPNEQSFELFNTDASVCNLLGGNVEKQSETFEVKMKSHLSFVKNDGRGCLVKNYCCQIINLHSSIPDFVCWQQWRSSRSRRSSCPATKR